MTIPTHDAGLTDSDLEFIEYRLKLAMNMGDIQAAFHALTIIPFERFYPTIQQMYEGWWSCDFGRWPFHYHHIRGYGTTPAQAIAEAAYKWLDEYRRDAKRD